MRAFAGIFEAFVKFNMKGELCIYKRNKGEELESFI